MALKYNLIVAVAENFGIGKNNDLPWKLKNEFAYFSKTTTETVNESKKNIVIMGRKSWESIPTKFRPLKNRINFVLTTSKDFNIENAKDSYVFNSWEDMEKKLLDSKFKETYEKIWITGGAKIYEDAMHSKHFFRLYLTRIMQSFDCDTFFPKLVENIKLVNDPNVPQGVQQENGIKWKVEVYENSK